MPVARWTGFSVSSHTRPTQESWVFDRAGKNQRIRPKLKTAKTFRHVWNWDSVPGHGSSHGCLLRLVTFKVVLHEQAHALRAFAVVTHGRERVAVAQDYPPNFAARRIAEPGANAAVPVQSLLKSGDGVDMGSGGI